MRRNEGMALARVVTAVALFTAAMLLVWAEPLRAVFVVVVTLFVWQGLREFYRLCAAKSVQPETLLGGAGGAAITLSAVAGRFELTALALCLTALAACTLQVLRGRLSIQDMSVSVFGLVYLGWFGAHAVLLHQAQDTGAGLVTYLLTIVALTDSGAYLIGSWIGKHKLAPRVSPNKTWEGSVGGFVFALIAAAIFVGLRQAFDWTVLPDWSLARYAGTAVVLSVIGQFGDLAESAMKRDAGVKDSGTIFPGHGGVLDRCDSYLFAAPVLYYLNSI
ncbi:MAG: phosphatidate cytidylyltransferase [Candidatus Hydrogenedentes bacterium]|nr:phosphatidate cytidylyltransferase [Candidatus Hydrogenedentota bacterium]